LITIEATEMAVFSVLFHLPNVKGLSLLIVKAFLEGKGTISPQYVMHSMYNFFFSFALMKRRTTVIT
jgi:hypothetical protein